MGDVFWATWNDCNGVFEVFWKRADALAAIGGPESEFMSVVPVKVTVIEGERERIYCNYDEDEREKWREPKANTYPQGNDFCCENIIDAKQRFR